MATFRQIVARAHEELIQFDPEPIAIEGFIRTEYEDLHGLRLVPQTINKDVVTFAWPATGQSASPVASLLKWRGTPLIIYSDDSEQWVKVPYEQIFRRRVRCFADFRGRLLQPTSREADGRWRRVARQGRGLRSSHLSPGPLPWPSAALPGTRGGGGLDSRKPVASLSRYRKDI